VSFHQVAEFGVIRMAAVVIVVVVVVVATFAPVSHFTYGSPSKPDIYFVSVISCKA
jgi:dolichyl-phosphate-mannose--protein O-mannosyl transferase